MLCNCHAHLAYIIKVGRDIWFININLTQITADLLHCCEHWIDNVTRGCHAHLAYILSIIWFINLNSTQITASTANRGTMLYARRAHLPYMISNDEEICNDEEKRAKGVFVIRADNFSTANKVNGQCYYVLISPIRR